MANYTGAVRGQVLGASIDQTTARDLPDPTTGKVALLTDAERSQWALMTGWGNPGYYVDISSPDGGHSGSGGSYAAVPSNVYVPLIIPPRVEYAHLCMYYTGAVKAVIYATTTDTTGVLLHGAAMVGTGVFNNPQGAASVTTTGVSGTSTQSPRALHVAADTTTAVPAVRGIQIVITRTDLSTTNVGFGGTVWGLRFMWDRPALNTWESGNTADSVTV